jgi:hypothetical protein
MAGSEPDRTALRAVAVCAKCGVYAFTIRIDVCGGDRAHCIGCGQAWEAPDWLAQNNPPPALEGNGHVSPHLVSPEARRRMLASERQARWRAARKAKAKGEA